MFSFCYVSTSEGVTHSLAVVALTSFPGSVSPTALSLRRFVETGMREPWEPGCRRSSAEAPAGYPNKK